MTPDDAQTEEQKRAFSALQRAEIAEIMTIIYL